MSHEFSSPNSRNTLPKNADEKRKHGWTCPSKLHAAAAAQIIDSIKASEISNFRLRKSLILWVVKNTFSGPQDLGIDDCRADLDTRANLP